MAFTRRIFTKEFRLNAAKLVVDEHRPESEINVFLLQDAEVAIRGGFGRKRLVTRP